MVRFQVVKVKDKTGKVMAERGTIQIPLDTWKRKGWVQGTRLDILEGVDGSMILRERRGN
jgi:hypothetical protein